MNFVKPVGNLYEHLTHLSDAAPEKVALAACDEKGNVEWEINYGQLKDKIRECASWLADLGVRDGDVLGLGIPNSVELLLLSWTAWGMGAITVPLDLKRDRMEQHVYKLESANAKILIAKKGVFSRQQTSGLRIKSVEIEDLKPVSSRDSAKVQWKKDLAHQALILFTSGTTANPKGVRLSLENLMANADAIKEWFKIKDSDRFLVLLPLHHINSTSFCLATMLAGGCIIVPPAYSNSRFWQQIAGSQASFTSIVPTICYDQLSREKEFARFRDKLRINRIQIGSAPVVVSDAKKFVEKYGIRLYQGYGQTETALRVTGVPLNIDEKTYQKLLEGNSIGTPVKCADVRIMDGSGKTLPEKTDGEIAVKGPMVMKGYLGKTNPFRNGYFMTGDIGYYESTGNERYFFLKGRSKEIIIKGGINLSPVAVEDKLKRLNGSIDQAYAIGLPDRRYGEEVAAVICWKKTADFEKSKAELKNQLASGRTSRYEAPKYLAAIDSERIPMTSAGKVQRSLLKKMQLDFEAVNVIASGTESKFLRLGSDNPEAFRQAFDLYNYCWQPLGISKETFSAQVRNGIVIAAVDKRDEVKGVVSLIRTNLGEKELSGITYETLTSGQSLSGNQPEGKNLVCVSICSSNYKAEGFPEISEIPGAETVRKYLESGLDPVFNFHKKAKGGFEKGAGLVAIIPNGRPEDRRALGYNLLLKYPELAKRPEISGASAAVQLMEAVMTFAWQLGISDVYAFSRPIGFADYAAKR